MVSVGSVRARSGPASTTGGGLTTLIITVSFLINTPSLALRRNVYEPGWLNVTAVVSELELANVAVPPVPLRVQKMFKAEAGGNESSVTLPCKAVTRFEMVWSGPALMTGGLLSGSFTLT